MRRQYYLVSGPAVLIFTDHANLVFLYDPSGRNLGIARTTPDNSRVKSKLSDFRYVIDHVSGDRNVWADMLTQGAVQPKITLKLTRVAHIKSLLFSHVNPGVEYRLDRPSLAYIRFSQRTIKETPPRRLISSRDCYKDYRGVYGIPKDDSLLLLLILIASNTGIADQRDCKTTKTTLAENFWYSGMYDDTKFSFNPVLNPCKQRQGR